MLQGVNNFVMQPFKEDMNLIDWALFTGLIITFVIMWLLVLREFKALT